LYPLKFKSIYIDKVWGGSDFNDFRSDVPEGKIGESWDVSCHAPGISIISNGKYKGMKLTELINMNGETLIGNKIDKEWFPLLIKLLNTSEKLSVQVHPGDDYAKRIENDMGKTEVWHIIKAKEGSSIIAGLKEGVTKEELKAAISEGTAEGLLNTISVKEGETYFIKSGLIHTICEGLLIAEIQQNSDTTYRLYDYNRGRELHIEKALDVIDFNLKGEKSTGLTVFLNGYSKTYICYCKDFSLELYNINQEMEEKSDEERFYIFTCTKGSGIIEYNEGTEEIKMGDSFLIPAYLGKYKIKGKLSLLKSYKPDMKEIEDQILAFSRK
jgi:mannose-6-phosphate isomerase